MAEQPVLRRSRVIRTWNEIPIHRPDFRGVQHFGKLVRDCSDGFGHVKSGDIHGLDSLPAYVLLDVGDVPYTYPLSGSLQWAYRRPHSCLHPNGPLRILRTPNMDPEDYRSRRTSLFLRIPRILWHILCTRSLGAYPPCLILCSTSAFLCAQCSQSSKTRQPPGLASLPGMDANDCLYLGHWKLALLALLDLDG